MCEDLLVCGRGAPFSKPIFRSRHIPMHPTDGGGPLSAPEERVTAYAYNISFRVRCCLRDGRDGRITLPPGDETSRCFISVPPPPAA